jgi:hypothetical protein
MSKRTKMIQSALGKDAANIALNRLEEDDKLSLEKLLLEAKTELRKKERALEDGLKNPNIVLNETTVVLVETIEQHKKGIKTIEKMIKDYLTD